METSSFLNPKQAAVWHSVDRVRHNIGKDLHELGSAPEKRRMIFESTVADDPCRGEFALINSEDGFNGFLNNHRSGCTVIPIVPEGLGIEAG